MRTLLIADIQIKCPYDRCQEQFGYAQYDTHIDQCQFNLITCSNCPNTYPKSAKEDHLSNCLETVKVAVAAKTSELELVKTELGQVKTELGQVKTELGHVKTELGQVKTELGQVKNTGFRYFKYNVMAVQLKPAEPTSYDFEGYNTRDQYQYYAKTSENEELIGTGLSNVVFAPN